jgi:hypothetical protein
VVDRVDRAEERLVGSVPQDVLEDRLEDEAGEDDQDQAGEAGDGKPLAPEGPPDECAAADRLVKRRAAAVEGLPGGINSAVAQASSKPLDVVVDALEVRPVGTFRAFGLPDLVVGHRPLLERVVARRRLAGRELAQLRRLDVAVALVEARAARVEHARRGRVDR